MGQVDPELARDLTGIRSSRCGAMETYRLRLTLGAVSGSRWLIAVSRIVGLAVGPFISATDWFLACGNDALQLC
jgi:hypothetical protein